MNRTFKRNESDCSENRNLLIFYLLKYLPNEGKPPAPDDEGLRLFLGSELDTKSFSEALSFLPGALVCDKFYSQGTRIENAKKKYLWYINRSVIMMVHVNIQISHKHSFTISSYQHTVIPGFWQILWCWVFERTQAWNGRSGQFNKLKDYNCYSRQRYACAQKEALVGNSDSFHRLSIPSKQDDNDMPFKRKRHKPNVMHGTCSQRV